MLLSEDEDLPTTLEKLDCQLSKLQNSIQLAEKSIRLVDSEQRADTEECKMTIKRNNQEIKQLRMQNEELQVRIKRCQMSDQQLISKSLREHAQDADVMKDKNGKEVIQMMDARILDLIQKTKALEHELHLKKCTMKHFKEMYGEMNASCRDAFENVPTEQDSIQHVRELENELQKVEQNLLESEVAKIKFEKMKAQLLKNQDTFPVLLQNLSKEFQNQEDILDNLMADEIPTLDETDIQKTKDSSVSAGGDCKTNPWLATKSRHDVFPGDTSSELKQFQESFDQIRDVTGVYNIQDAESRILVQKSIQEDLLDLRKKAAKRLHDLKEEKKELTARLDMMRGADNVCLKREMEDDLQMGKTRQEEQEDRKCAARQELERLNFLLADVKTSFHNAHHLLQTELLQVEPTKKDMDILELALDVERILRRKFAHMKYKTSGAKQTSKEKDKIFTHRKD